MACFTQALPLFLGFSLSLERGVGFTPCRNNKRYSRRSYLDRFSPQGSYGIQQKASALEGEEELEEPFVTRREPTKAASDAKSNNMGSYLDTLSDSSGGVPKSSKEKKQAAYSKRPLEEETNPMMAARSYLDRLNGPPSNSET